MSPVAGQRLGPYEIVAPIGAGGMGEVWRARDTRLDRSVAVKMIPAELAANAQLRTRFEREARSISQLSHPNICALFDVGDDYLVMELLDGESLADRLSRGRLPLDQVLRVGIEVASALHCAHRSGIVHRDLKPGNVMLTKSGAKLLDFGLAKPMASDVVPLGTAAATQQQPLTEEGTIVGTYFYMSPEQLAGGPVDHRSDVFALGALLYEMITGRRAFEGKTKASVIASILDRDPQPLTAVNPEAPAPLERVVASCLAKDPEERWQSAHDVALELKALRDVGTVSATMLRTASGARWPGYAVAVAAIVIAAMAGYYAAARLAQRPGRVHLNIDPPPGAQIVDFVLSPRGDRAALIVRHQKTSLWLRDLSSSSAREVEHSDGATLPFWSPDGQWIGFLSDQALYKVSVSGGAPLLIHDGLGFVRGGSWGADDVIIFGQGAEGGIARVAASGGTITPVTTPDRAKRETAHIWPSFLPDGRHFLYLSDARAIEDHLIRIGSIDSREAPRTLLAAESNAAFAGGFLLFVKARTLMAQTFDPGPMRLSGNAVAIEGNIADTDFHHYIFSATDRALAFGTFDPRSRLHIADRSGKDLAVLGEPADWTFVAWSPDGKHAVLNRVDADRRNDQLWMADLIRGTFDQFAAQPTRIMSGVWSRDGSEVLYTSETALFRKRVDGSEERRVEAVADVGYPSSWLGDLVAIELPSKTNPADVAAVSLSTGKSIPVAATPAWEGAGVFSPDGRWIAYGGDGRIFVKPFPPTGAQFTVSSAPGEYPHWRGDGRELYYTDQTRMFAVPIEIKGSSIEAGTPQVLFTLMLKDYKNRSQFDVSPDGKRFLLNLQDSYERPAHILFDWTSALRP